MSLWCASNRTYTSIYIDMTYIVFCVQQSSSVSHSGPWWHVVCLWPAAGRPCWRTCRGSLSWRNRISRGSQRTKMMLKHFAFVEESPTGTGTRQCQGAMNFLPVMATLELITWQDCMESWVSCHYVFVLVMCEQNVICHLSCIMSFVMSCHMTMPMSLAMPHIRHVAYMWQWQCDLTSDDVS